jgi:hypothetical protein
MWADDRKGRSERKEDTVKRLTLITLILGTALALVPAASAMVLTDGSVSTKSGVPATQPTNPATQAQVFRSEELASYYGLDPATQAVVLRSKALASYYGISPATQAVLLRSKGLANYYAAFPTDNLGNVTFRPDILGGNGGSQISPISTGGSSFDWNTTIGASLGALLLAAMAGAVITRRKHILSF